MNKYFEIPEEQQRLVLTQTAARVGLPEQAVEKDLWVTVILQLVFALPFRDKEIAPLFKEALELEKVCLPETL